MINCPGLSLSNQLYLLDIYPSAVFAWGFRKLRSAYSGNWAKIRRSSDNATQDIGFIGNLVDYAAIASFCGAGSGYLDTLYDQSGNSRNLLQATLGNQIQIYNSGAFYTSYGTKGRPVAYLNQGQWAATSGSLGITGNPAITISCVMTQEGTNNYSCMACYGVNTTSAALHYPIKNNATITQTGVGFTARTNYAYYTYTNNATLSSHIWTHTAGATGAGTVGNLAYLNGASASLTSDTTLTTPNLTSGKLVLGACVDLSTTYAAKGGLGEWIWWGSKFTASQALNIYQNQARFYGL